MIRHSDRLLTALLAGLLLWAPLPFAGAVPWAEAGLRVLAFAALALAMAAVDRFSALRVVALPAAALAAVALYGLLQSLHWPAGLAALLSPEHARLFHAAASLLGEPLAAPVAPIAPIAVSPRLTLAASASRSAALTWAAAAAALVAGAAAGRERRHRRVLGGALLAGALFQVIFGARGWFARSREIWGVEVTSNPARLRGTFVNPNHLALYLGIALTAAFAWMWWTMRRAAEEPLPERRVAMVAPPALAWLTLFAGLAFTGSRAGLLAAVAAVSAQGGLLALAGAGRRWRFALLGVAAAVLGLGMVAALGFREGLGRIADTSVFDVSLGARLDAYRAALELWWRFPLTGTGLGTFRDAFPLVQPAILEGTWWHAHSDLLEVPVTTGLMGMALVGVGAWALARRLLAVLRHGRRSEDRAAALALLGGLAGLAVHEALDFGLTMPANALTLAVLAGAAASAGTRQSAQADAPGESPAEQRLDLQQVQPGGDESVGKQDRGKTGRAARRRRHRKRSQAGAIEP
jgi:O-antigen ligase